MQLKSKILLVSLGLAGALLTGCSSVDLNPMVQINTQEIPFLIRSHP